MDHALQMEGIGGDAEYALLRTIREHNPGCQTLTLRLPSRGRYRSFLSEQGESVRTLMGAEHFSIGHGGGLRLQLAWHAFHRIGGEVEAVVVPGSVDRSVILVGPNKGMIRKLAREVREFCSRPIGRTLVYSNNAWSEDEDLDRAITKASWNDIVLPTAQKGEIRLSVEGFFGRREAYRRMGVSWRRGVLLVGPPGTGKTMVTKAAASSVPEHPFLYVRDLSGYDTPEEIIAEVFGRARDLAPAMLVFEDIDGFVGDHNRAVFLNELDGFKANDGLLVLASSNHPERVDEALLKRPSRFDRVFHIGLPEEDERREYCLGLLARPELLERVGGRRGAEVLAAKVARATGGFTPAYLQEAFVSAALRIAHDDGPEEDQGISFAELVLEQVSTLRSYMAESREPEKLAEMRDPSRPGLGFRS